MGINRDIKLLRVQEAVRVHDDRISYLEGRHGSLHVGSRLKVAKDCEFQDWMTNRSEEDWLTILGLPRLGQMLSREWQVAARRQVTNFLKDVLHQHRVRLEFSVLHVTNPVKHRPAGQTVLNVRMNSIAVSKRIREVYSGFFSRTNNIQLPNNFRGISVRNKVTLATRIRIRIMQQFADKYIASNPGASATVKGYDSRPVLVTMPPRGSTTLCPRSFNFIEACTMLPPTLSDDALAQVFQVVGTSHQGELRSVFIVLNDDDRERCETLAKNSQASRRGPGPSASASAPHSSGFTSSGTGASQPAHFSGFASGAGTGMDVQGEFLRLLKSPPPPPPPPRTTSLAPRRSRERSVSDSSHHDPRSTRGLKRARQDEDDVSKKAKRSRRFPSSSSRSSSREPPRRRATRRSSSGSSSPSRTRATKTKRSSHGRSRRSPSSSSASSHSVKIIRKKKSSHHDRER